MSLAFDILTMEIICIYQRRNAKHTFLLGYEHTFSNSKQLMYRLIFHKIYCINLIAGFLESQTTAVKYISSTPYNSNAHSIMPHHTHLPRAHRRLVLWPVLDYDPCTGRHTRVDAHEINQRQFVCLRSIHGINYTDTSMDNIRYVGPCYPPLFRGVPYSKRNMTFCAKRGKYMLPFIV
jgi:hypothetical protein